MAEGCQPRQGIKCTFNIVYIYIYIDGLVQERRNSRALAMELRLSCIDPSISSYIMLSNIIICSIWDIEKTRIDELDP